MPPFGGQSIRDKTTEFRAIAERLRKEQGAAGPSGAVLHGAQPLGSGATQNGAFSQQSEAARKAARIGQGIHSTSQKLHKLAQLAKRTSKFDDPAQEINELSTLVKQDIQTLNVAIADLQSLSARTTDGNKQSISHSHTVVDNLRTRLKDTTKDFKDVLTKRTEVLKSNQDRRNLFSIRPDEGPSWQRPSSSQPQRQEQPLFGEAAFKSRGDDDAGPSSSERTPFLSQSSQQQQLQLMQPQDSYLTSRAEALHNVESTITELGGIFQQLAHMVQEQGELTVRIDENVEETLANVDSAQAQLLKYLNSISSNRWLIMKVFFVMLAFLVFFIVFIA
ncbi:hypothetical protein WJX84_007299 [Apatococcus fuscideae]|uniref:t-SNARE coiled-coil homology domain-containing protein n=1 Tax=Apatococcus fuscideae TaxID=2026836 RepID=A0AAW1SN81_9CHLO